MLKTRGIGTSDYLALWSYRISVRLSVGVTLFLHVYGSEAVLPVEIQLPAVCLALAAQLDPFHND